MNSEFAMKRKDQKRFPYNAYVLPFFFLALAGLVDSLYLAISHYRNYTDILYSSFCAISDAINCDTVSQSSWSIFLGIPIAWWGAMAYGLVIAISVPALKNTSERRMHWYVLFWLSFIYSLAAIAFGYVSAVKINAYCVLCLLSYVISFGLLFSSWIICRRFNSDSFFTGLKQGIASIFKNIVVMSSILVLFVLFTCVKVFLPHYWLYELPPSSENIARGFTEDNHPWIGSTHPSVVIEEFSDYQCFQCSKTHLILRILMNQYPDKIKLIHHHYPLDNKFNPMLIKAQIHEGSGQMALLALAAGKQDKFWQANDFLYSIARKQLRALHIDEFADKLGLNATQLRNDMNAKDTLKILEEDISEGLKNKMLGTPSFLIDGKVYLGTIPQDVLEKLLL